IGAVRDAMRQDRITSRGKLHAVWILAHIEAASAADCLLDLARSEPDPRVAAQAVRAVADLSDPVLVRHRLASGRGDPELAAKLAALSGRRDPRIVLELTNALGRLRWPETPRWLCQALKQPDLALQHAAVQAM